MINLNVRWRQPLNEPVTCPPVSMRDLTVIRQNQTIRAFDERGRQVWCHLIPGGADGELAANDDILVATSTHDDGEQFQTQFDLFDEGALNLASLTAEGTLRRGGLVAHGKNLHAWMEDKGIALRKMQLPPENDELTEVLVPFAQPWDDNVTKHGVVLIGFTGRREGACLWDPRTESMQSLVTDADVWSHAVSDDVAVFAIGASENQTTVIGVDLASRLEIWRREHTTRAIAACDEGILVYLGATSRVPALLDRHTGEILWKSPTVHNGLTWEVAGSVAFARGPQTAVYDIATGECLGLEMVSSGVTAFDEYFVAVCGDEIVAFDYPGIADGLQPHVIVTPSRAVGPRTSTPIMTPRVQPALRRA